MLKIRVTHVIEWWQRHSVASRRSLGLLPAAVLLAAGCTHSDPVRVEEDFGNSVRHMIDAQIYNPEAAEHPIIDPPRPLDGPKGEAVLDAYRADVPKPQGARQPPALINIGD